MIGWAYQGTGPALAGSIEVGISGRIQAYVAKRLSVTLPEIEVARLAPINNGHGPLISGDVMDLRPSNPGKLLGRVVFIVTMRQPGKPPIVQWVSGEVSRLQEAVVAKRVLRRHHVIRPEDLETQSVRIRRQAVVFENNPDVFIGKRMVRSVRKGEALRSDLVEKAPVILRGERIMITLALKGLRLSTFGKAKEDGFLGEVIKVMNIDSRKVIFAKVIAAGHVIAGLNGGH